MTLLQALILGIVEGVTEFLPISSTGHLILAQKLLGMEPTDMLASFDIAIQLGAILAALIVYARLLLQNRRVWFPVIVAFLPTAALGALLHSMIKSYLLGNATVVAWSLLVGGILIIVFERTYRPERATVRAPEDISLLSAFGIGLAQSLALIPGVSRAAATIIGGMMLKVDRRTIVDFSFLLAIPTMVAATVFDLMKSAGSFSSHDGMALAVGFIAAFITALAAIRWLLAFIKTNTFTAFGVYRIIIGILFLLFLR